MSSGINKAEVTDNSSALLDCVKFVERHGDPLSDPLISSLPPSAPLPSIYDLVNPGNPSASLIELVKIGEGSAGEVFTAYLPIDPNIPSEEGMGEGEGGREGGGEGEGEGHITEKVEIFCVQNDENERGREAGERECEERSPLGLVHSLHNSFSDFEFSDSLCPTILHLSPSSSLAPSPSPSSLSPSPSLFSFVSPSFPLPSSSSFFPTTLDSSWREGEKRKAFSLLEILTQSGDLVIDDVTVHVISCTSIQFTECLLDVLCRQNVNPIENVTKVSHSAASLLFGVNVDELLMEGIDE
jgi:hypothetical protein